MPDKMITLDNLGYFKTKLETEIFPVLAAPYSNSKKYRVGDLCIHDKSLYRCVSAFDSEGWNASKWEQTTLGDEIPPMKYVTYDELVDLRDNSSLIPGMRYRIIDYVTKVNGVLDLSVLGKTGAYLPYATSEETAFDIIVTAVDKNHIDENAKASRPISRNGGWYSNDEKLKIESWELKYSLDNNIDQFSWADSAHGKGVIYYMKDAQNNEARYDFKSIKFLMFALRRADNSISKGASFEYDASTNPYRYGTLMDVFSTLQGNSPGGNLEFDVGDLMGTSLINLIVFITDVSKDTLDAAMDWTYMLSGISQIAGMPVDLATLASLLGTTEAALESMTERQVLQTFFNADFYYTFNGRILDEEIPGTFTDVDLSLFSDIRDLCHDNKIGHCVDPLSLTAKTMLSLDMDVTPWGLNMIAFQVVLNVAEGLDGIDPIYGNTFGTNCFTMAIGKNSYSNVFGDSCWANRMASGFQRNVLGSGCYLNSFENDCQDNTFLQDCQENQIGQDVRFNTLGNTCKENTIGNGAEYNSFGNGCNHNTFAGGCDYNSLGNDCNQIQLGANCDSNSFGNECYSIQLEDECNSNSFGNLCNSNQLGNNCYSNSFGNDCRSLHLYQYCSHNSFGNSCQSGELGENGSYNSFGNGVISFIVTDYVTNCIFENGVYIVTLDASSTFQVDGYLSNVKVCQDVQGTPGSRLTITATRGLSYQVEYKMTGSTEILL